MSTVLNTTLDVINTTTNIATAIAVSNSLNVQEPKKENIILPEPTKIEIKYDIIKNCKLNRKIFMNEYIYEMGNLYFPNFEYIETKKELKKDLIIPKDELQKELKKAQEECNKEQECLKSTSKQITDKYYKMVETVNYKVFFKKTVENYVVCEYETKDIK